MLELRNEVFKMIEPREAVKKMDEYKPLLEGRRGLLRLDFNENTIGPSPRVIEAIKDVKDDDIAAYPEYAKFKAKLAEYLQIEEWELMITNATDEAIMVVMQTYIDKGDEVVIPVPTFAMFKFYAQVQDAKIVEVLYNADLSFPIRKVTQSINDKTKMVFLCNPNNPTGTPIKKQDIVKILEKAKNSIVLVDEAYVQYNGETCIDLIEKYDNLVVIQTFSKAYGMGGLRLGYAISNRENMINMEKIKSPYSVNTIAIKAANAAIKDQKYIIWYTNEVKKGKKLMYEELRKLKIKAYETSGNFMIVKIGNKSREIEEKLREKGILVRDRSSYPLLAGCLRIGIGTKTQAKQLIQALKEIK